MMYSIGIVCLCILIFVRKGTVALEVTLSWNGTSASEATVAQGSALALMCTTSQDVVSNAWVRKKSSGSLFIEVFDVAFVLPGICGFDGQIPVGFTFSCISARAYTCTIGAIQSDDHGDTWRCDAEINNVLYNGNTVQISVLVGVSLVTLTPDFASLSVIAGISTQLQCRTSAGRPVPTVTWYKINSASGAAAVEITSHISSTSYEEGTTSPLRGTTSTLTYTPSRADDSWRIYCTADNVGSPVQSSRMPSLNVSYGPSPPVCIYREQTETGPISIIQGSTFVISCTSDSKPASVYTWTYPGGAYSGQALTLPSIKTLNDGIFTVEAKYTVLPSESTSVTRTNSSNIQVNILYPPTVPTFRIGNFNVSGTIKIISGNSKTMSCSSQSNPSPRYTWTPGGTANNADLVLSNVQHPLSSKQYTCIVENTMQPTRDTASVTEQANATVAVEVLFPPSTPVFHYPKVNGTLIDNNILAVVRGESLPVYCVSQANPPVSSYSWSNQSPASQVLDVASITGNTTRICTAQNTMVETYGSSDIKYGDSRTGTQTQALTIVVWVPPAAPSITYQPQCTTTRSVSPVHTVKIIEGDSFCLSCYSSSSPAASYSWSASGSSSSVLNIPNVTRDITKQATCFAENRMVTTFNGTVTRGNQSSVNLDVLYGPRVGTMNAQQIVKGKAFQFACPYTPGYPPDTTFVWTLTEPGRTWNGITLNLTTVRREDDGVYTCTASNILNPTAGPPGQIGRSTGSFHLEVLYGAENMVFSTDKFPGAALMNVSENTYVNMSCMLESNPGSTMIISKDGEQKHDKTNTKSLSYTIDGRCEEAGVYTCTGHNQYPGSPSKQIDVRVLCAARRSPYIQIQTNVSRPQAVNATFSFHTQAYPDPQYTWQNCSSSCTDMVNGVDYYIYSSGLVSNLTIFNVQLHDYGSYRVVVSNGIGTAWNETFLLIPYDRPNMPTEFRALVSTVTPNEVTVAWTPGFSGGPQQIFHILYKKQSGGTWLENTVNDTGAKGVNFTITGLTPGTEYQAFMFSHNIIGSSKGTDNITFTTSQLPTSPPGTPAALIGGAVGGSTAAVIIIVVVVIVVMRKRQGGHRKQKDGFTGELMKTNQQQNEEIPDEVKNPMYISAEEVTSNTANAEYASPVKKKPINTGSGDLYATVDPNKKSKSVPKDKGKKKKDKHNKTDVYENPPLGATKKTYDNKAFEENLYENNESVSNRKHVSPDGLIYADLDFPNQPKGQKRLVIHGLDDRTEYAEVDLTRKADPLPDSDSEDKKNDKKPSI